MASLFKCLEQMESDRQRMQAMLERRRDLLLQIEGQEGVDIELADVTFRLFEEKYESLKQLKSQPRSSDLDSLNKLGEVAARGLEHSQGEDWELKAAKVFSKMFSYEKGKQEELYWRALAFLDRAEESEDKRQLRVTIEKKLEKVKK